MSGYRCVSECRGGEFDPGQSHPFVEINHEIIPRLLSESLKKGCQLQAKVCARSIG